MKTSIEQALADSEARCTAELRKASDRAQALYESLSAGAINRHEKRVDKIITKEVKRMSPAGVAFAKTHDVEAYRRECHRRIATLRHHTGHEYQALWNEAHARLFESTGFNVAAVHTKKAGSKLDLITDSGLLGQLIEAINSMLRDPLLYQNRPPLGA